MHAFWKVLLVTVGTTGTYETVVQLKEHAERAYHWQVARAYCDMVGKPLLRIGMSRSAFDGDPGDVTLDIDSRVLDIPGGVLGDERDMPFPDKYFGCCFNQHTLEHLHTAEDVELAVNEGMRVADYQVLLAPSPHSIYATLFCPSHYLRMWFDNENQRIVVRDNKWRTGLGFDGEGNRGDLGQAMVIYEELNLPVIVKG